MPPTSSRERLLTSETPRSHVVDAEEGGTRVGTREPAAGCFTVLVERMLPEARGHAIEVNGDTTVEELTLLYFHALAGESPPCRRAEPYLAAADAALAAAAAASVTLRDADVAATRVLRLAGALRIRFVFDGAELSAMRMSLSAAGVGPYTRLIALVSRRRSLARTITWCMLSWWPLLLTFVGFCALGVILSPPLASRECAFPLLQLAAIGSLLILVYGLIFSGLFQDRCGRRLFWPLRLKVRGANFCFGGFLAFSFVCCIGLAVALWSNAAIDCKVNEPGAYWASFVVWIVLLAANSPWLLILILPCLLVCGSPMAFSIIAHLSGARGGSMQR